MFGLRRTSDTEDSEAGSQHSITDSKPPSYSKLRYSISSQAPQTPQHPQRTQPPVGWGQRSLSDLYVESALDLTPGTPRSLLSPAGEIRGSYLPSTPLKSQETLTPLYPNAPTHYIKRDWVSEGSIVQLHERDDIGFMPTWKRYLYLTAPFLAVATLTLYWLYFALRIRFVISSQRKSHTSFPLAWIFIAFEISVAVPSFLQSASAIFILKKRNRPKLRLVGNDVPTVDVLITCCGEEDEVVLDTIRAACDVDYPADRFRIIILDDGKSDVLKQAAQDMESTYPNVYYMRRPKFPGVPHHYKAGNLNYGLDEVHNLPGGAGEYMAGLDADMIPERDWLRAIVPHLLVDDKMALACPPQLFYNVPPGDPLYQSLDFFIHVSEPMKDALGVAWCTGSGYVVRRDALSEIGNFPCGSLAEDVAMSTLLLGRGWKTAYVHEPLQFGTVPGTFSGHLKQRTRWAIGTVDTSFKLNFCLWGEKIRRLTGYQRMSSFIYAVFSLFNIFLTLSLFAMPVVLMSNKPLVAYANETQLRWLIRTCFAALVVNRLTELALYLPSGYAAAQRGGRAHLWMSPYIAISIIRSFLLPLWLGGKKEAFKSSGSLKSDLNERDPTIRAPMFRRLRVIIFDFSAWFHMAYVYFCMVAVVLSSYRCIVEQRTLREKLVCLLTHAFWPPLAWIIIISAFWIPVSYACDPPNMPDREELLNRDQKTGIAHPTPKSKKIAFMPQTALFELEYTISTAFTTLVFAAAFFY